MGEVVGLRSPADTSLGAVAGTVVGSSLLGAAETTLVGAGPVVLAFLAAVLFSSLGRILMVAEWRLREIGMRHAAQRSELTTAYVAGAQTKGLLVSFLKGAAISGAALAVGLLLCRLGLWMVPVGPEASRVGWWALWGTCLGVAAGQFLKVRVEALFLVLGVTAGAVLLLLL
jgi:hypothetical protein